MIKHKSIGIIAALLMAASVMFLSIGYFNPSILENFIGSSEPPYAAVMDKTQILDVQIVADEADWANMLENATAEEYIVATVIINGVKINNVGIRPKGNSSLSQVARDSTTDRYSFKIEFDHYVAGKTWLGLDKIVFNNMQGDSTYMKEYLSYDLMAYTGVDTPLYTFSNISVNGEEWGFYLAVEALEDSYAKRVYGNDHGKLYKPESMGMRGNGQMDEFIGNMQGDNAGNNEQQGNGANQGNMPDRGQNQEQLPAQGGDNAIPGRQNQGNPPTQGQIPDGNAPNNMPEGGQQGGFRDRGGMGGFGGMGGGSGGQTLQYTDDEITSYSVIFEGAVFDITDNDRRSLISALEKLNAGENLESVVDVEATLKYFAAHAVIVNLDSYISNMCHNYYLYEKNGQLTMLPWDFNLAFGGFQSGSASSIVNFPIDTPVSGVSLEDRPILAKLLEVPEYLELYHSYLREIVDGYFNNGMFEQTVDLLNALISQHVQSDPSAFYSFDAYQSGVAELKKLGMLRAESIEGQLDGIIPATTAGQNANPSALVDASSINLSALGSMGGGGGGGFGGMADGGGMQDFNFDNMQRAMEIIQVAGENGLTEEQLSELQELGITEEQITMFQSMGQGSFGGERPANAQGGFDGERPSNTRGGEQGGMNRPQGNQMPGDASNNVAAGFDGKSLIILITCTMLLFGGLLFVVFYKRRRSG